LGTSKPGPVMQYLTKKKIYLGFLFNNNKIVNLFIIFNFCAFPKLIPRFLKAIFKSPDFPLILTIIFI